ncbi:MAG: hypothetical protein HRU36_01795 [Rickettsiales bacterium]|nr:hypothetical protein [Rickettsiales bacterium]
MYPQMKKNYPLMIALVVITLSIAVIAKFGIGPGTNTDVISKTFPSVKGIDLLGNTVTVPESFKGDKIIVAIGFKREHQKEIDSWNSILKKFIKEDKSISFYIVPVIYKTNFFRRLWINNSMRFATSDEEERRRIITVYTDQKKFANHLSMKVTKPYILILDKNKNILQMLGGNPNADKLKILNNILEAK